MLYYTEMKHITLYEFDWYRYNIVETWGVRHRGSSFPPNESIICLGASQTFGRLSNNPFPNRLYKLLNRPVLNFGFGHVRPLSLWHSTPHRRILTSANIVIAQMSSWNRNYANDILLISRKIPHCLRLGMRHEFFTTSEADLNIDISLIPNTIYLDDKSHQVIAQACLNFLST